MISGISSGSYFPASNVAKGRAPAPAPQQSPAPEIHTEAQPAEVKNPEGDQQSLTREFTLFDLAVRQFSQILPRLELATTPVE